MFDRLLEHFLPLAYQIGRYAMLNLLDDPAMLALVFC